MRLGARSASAFSVVVALLGSLVVAGAAGADADKMDQSCVYDSPYAFASYTSGQSFTPTMSSITRWQVRLGVIDAFDGDIKSRLVLYPTGDASVAIPGSLQSAAGPGIPLAETSTRVQGGRFSFKWVSFAPSSPVAVAPLPAKASYEIEVDFPTDPSFKPYGGHIGWAPCSGPYAGGLAWQTLNLDSMNRAGITPVGPPSPSLAGVPVVRVSDPRVSEFEFRIYGR